MRFIAENVSSHARNLRTTLKHCQSLTFVKNRVMLSWGRVVCSLAMELWSCNNCRTSAAQYHMIYRTTAGVSQKNTEVFSSLYRVYYLTSNIIIKQYPYQDNSTYSAIQFN